MRAAPEASGERTWAAVTAVEAVAACAAVAGDLVVPSLVLAAMAVVSLLARREHWSSLGFRRPECIQLVPKMFAFAAVWSVFQLSVTMPVANHLSGREQDLGDFERLEGNAGMLLAMLVLGWTIGALVEEVAYRGYLQTRLRQVLGNSTAALVAAIVVSSALFGRVHSEQGVVGMAVVAVDGAAWSVLRYRYDTLWASVLAHGFNNTIGFVTFFLVGLVHGLW